MKEEILHEYTQIAEKSAHDFAQSKLWKEKLKQYLSVLTLEHHQTSTSVAQAEVKARADRRYQEALKSAAEVIQRAEIARAKMKSIEMTLDWWRTLESSKRAEMKYV
jgi:membrane-anchored protein YejM (alkaline phosphatase superfamily)